MEKFLKKEYNYGIDMLRIFAMFQIVVLHVLGCGGVLDASKGAAAFGISWLLEISSYSAVNCYALISGFCSYSLNDKKHHYSRFIELWLEVVLYGLLITSLFKWFNLADIGIGAFVAAILPVGFNQYWYFTAYTGVFLLIPYLNRLVNNIDYKMSKRLLVLLFFLFSLYPTCMRKDIFHHNYGYSFLWIGILYIVGAIIRKYELHKKIKKKKLLIVFLVGCILITWCWKMYGSQILYKYTGLSISDNLLISYTSPTIVAIGIVLFLLFSNMHVGKGVGKLVTFIAPATFGVYLSHTQPLVSSYILMGEFSWIGTLHPAKIPFVVLISALVIFVMCVLIDKVRSKIFSILRIRARLEKIEGK